MFGKNEPDIWLNYFEMEKVVAMDTRTGVIHQRALHGLERDLHEKAGHGRPGVLNFLLAFCAGSSIITYLKIRRKKFPKRFVRFLAFTHFP